MPYNFNEKFSIAEKILRHLRPAPDKQEWVDFTFKKTGAAEKLLIRKAKIKDLKEVSRLNLELFKYQQQLDPTANLEWTNSRDGRKYFKARIKRADGFVEIAETSDKKIVGYIIGTILKRPLWRINALYAELESVIVENKYQGCGLGARLTADFLKWCKENKVNHVSLLVDPKNEAAIKFYRKIGFSDYDLVMQLDLKK